VPADSSGVVAVICVSDTTVNWAAESNPNDTPVAPVKPDPVIVTDVPPATGPAVGLTPVTTGGVTYVK
jgi:hypothetical protein